MFKNIITFFISSTVLFCFVNISVANDSISKTVKHKSGYKSSGTFAGPNSTVGELEREDRVSKSHFVFPAIDETLKPWFKWKRSLMMITVFS